MGTAEFDDLAARLRGVADVVNAFKAEAVQLRVVEALISAHVGRSSTSTTPPNPSSDSSPELLDPSRTRKGTPRKAPAPKAIGEKVTARRRSTGGNAFNLVDDIDLSPVGKEPFDEFIERAQPKNHIENCVAAVYWFVEISKTTASDDRIYTVYRLQGWTLPAYLTKELSRPRLLDWANTSDRKDIQLTVVGINYVEKTMLKRPTKVTA